MTVSDAVAKCRRKREKGRMRAMLRLLRRAGLRDPAWALTPQGGYPHATHPDVCGHLWVKEYSASTGGDGWLQLMQHFGADRRDVLVESPCDLHLKSEECATHE